MSVHSYTHKHRAQHKYTNTANTQVYKNTICNLKPIVIVLNCFRAFKLALLELLVYNIFT